MQERCQGITGAGNPCRARAVPGIGYCMMHTPDELIPEMEQRLGFGRCKRTISQGSNAPRKRCSRPEINGTGYCEHHQRQGQWLVTRSYDQGRIVARIRQTAEEAGIDTTRVSNPLQALLEIAAEAMAFKDELGRRVVALEEHEWTYEHVAGEQIKGDILLYERAMDRIARLLATITRLGVEERLARVTERQAVLMEQALALTFQELDLPLKTQDQARELMSRHLRAIA